MSLKLSALFACGLLFIASAGFGEEPAATVQSGRADRTALRSQFRRAAREATESTSRAQ